MGNGWDKLLDLGITLLELRWCGCGPLFDHMSNAVYCIFKLRQVKVLFLNVRGFYGRVRFIVENTSELLNPQP